MTKYTNTGNKDTRSGFGEGLLAIGRECKDVVALAADLKGSVKMDAFAKEFPERFFQAGIAEANMINVAAGLSLNGKIPFVQVGNGGTKRLINLDQLFAMLGAPSCLPVQNEGETGKIRPVR